MFDLSVVHIILVLICALLIGVAKTGLPTLGILVVAVMASIFPARESIGIVLPMLITADVIAVTYYRRNVNWKTLFRLVPWVLGGLFLGFIVLFFVEASRPIEIMLGGIILLMIGIQLSRERWGASWTENIPQSTWFAAGMGTLAGFTTMIGNAAGPVMAIFLLAIALPKQEFIGTGAWFFISVNLIKVPMYAILGLITPASLTFNLWLAPVILLGTYLGIKCLPLIPQRTFNIAVLVLAVFGGVRLLVG
ncbi:sulfite exporter TauE/SafE family protein [Salibacterium aidingense]|uniref:sulfite exporter TauE/SafE family protein n=1 Tax=Salibacterium aidingense TaxID=384933 RepID=UPI0004202313|nr:sulfite exporter TauE/SafE family protein [Salibacterium aidingense]